MGIYIIYIHMNMHVYNVCQKCVSFLRQCIANSYRPVFIISQTTIRIDFCENSLTNYKILKKDGKVTNKSMY